MFGNMKLQEIKPYKSYVEKTLTNYYPDPFTNDVLVFHVINVIIRIQVNNDENHTFSA